MHILAVIVLHQHNFCVYKGKRKLKLLIICENLVRFALQQFLFCFVNMFLENVVKKFTVGGRGLEWVGGVTINTTVFFFFFFSRF